MNLTISKMEKDDIAAVKFIEMEENLSPWSFADYESEIENPDSLCLTAKVEKEVAGFLIARLIMTEHCADLLNIGIKNKFKRRHFASGLLDKLYNTCRLNDLHIIWLEVRESNLIARLLYEKHKFSKHSIRKNYYTFPVENALLMIKEIDCR